MPQLIVHIGTHKTGTTSIQALLARSSRAIARHGAYVPKAGCISPSSAGQHNIGWALRGDPRARAEHGTLDDLATELRGVKAPRAVISSEDFEYLVDRPDLLKTFEAKIRAVGWEPTYLLFLRAADSYAISLFHELAKHGDQPAFDAFVAEILETGRLCAHGDWSFYFDYRAFVRKWRAATTGDLEIRSYDSAAAGIGVVETFLGCIGVPATLAGELPTFGERLRRAIGIRSAAPASDRIHLNASAVRASDGMRALAAKIAEKYPMPLDLLSDPALPPGGIRRDRVTP